MTTQRQLLRDYTHVHGVSASRLLTGVALGQTPVDGVGKRVFPEVRQELLVNLESGEVFYAIMSAVRYPRREFCSPSEKRTRSLDSLLGKGIDLGSLVALGVDEFVVDDLDLGVLVGQQDDLISDGLGVRERGDVLSNTGEAELNVLGLGALQLGLALLAEDDQLVAIGLLGDQAADVAGHARVNTTAQALVGGADDQ